jgi:hypothetical protein
MTSSILSKLLTAGAVSMALCGAGAAQAAVYDVSFADSVVAGDFFVTTAGSTVTAISGWVSDSDVAAGNFTITGLSPFASADQQFNPAFPYVDFSGLSFSTVGGGDYNFADAGGGHVYLVSSVLDPAGVLQAQGLTEVQPTVSLVPEPGNVSLLLAGMFCLAAVARRRAAR